MKTLNILLLILVLLSCENQNQKESNFIQDDTNNIDVLNQHPFAHVVYFWLKNPENNQDRADFEKAIKKLLSTSKYIQSSYLGRPVKSERDVVDDSWTYQIILYFDDNAQQELYQDEDAHQAFIKEANQLWEKVVVYDGLEIE